MLTLYKPFQPVAWGFKAASWGHEYFPNPDFDEMRHTLTGYLATERWGVEIATDVTMGNELLGLWLDIRTPGPGTAFEWRDVLNNYRGISLWKENNNAK